MLNKDWNEESKVILKSILAQKNIKYHELAQLLNEIGLEESHNSIASKISRGTFSFSFFLQCIYVLDINSHDLDF